MRNISYIVNRRMIMIISSILIGVIFLSIGLILLTKNIPLMAKNLNMQFEHFSLIVNISINVIIIMIMLTVMFITIHSSTSSTRQLIAENKKMTDKQISELRDIELNRRKTAIRAIRKELELNLDIISRYLDKKDDYLSGKMFSVEKIALSNFDQGLSYLATDDEVLINKILSVYHHLRTSNLATESILVLEKIPLTNKTDSIKKWTKIVINNYEEAKPAITEILTKLQKLEKEI